jgi:hypothetical protein
MGGGARFFTPSWWLQSSYPSLAGGLWQWSAGVAMPDGAGGTLTVYAICLPGTATSA